MDENMGCIHYISLQVKKYGMFGKSAGGQICGAPHGSAVRSAGGIFAGEHGLGRGSTPWERRRRRRRSRGIGEVAKYLVN